MARIGVQAMMLKNEVAEHGAFDTLARMREIGYRTVEVSQIPMTEENVDQLAKAREELGIEFAALSAGMTKTPNGNDSLVEDFDKIIADCRRLGAGMVRIGMLPIPSMRNLDTVLEFCDRSDEIAVRMAEQGVQLYYHNHHIEFTKYDGRLLLDIIAERAPHVGLELDVHWLARGGVDPVRTIERFAGRVAMVHLKDYRIAKLTEDLFDELEKGDGSRFWKAWGDLVQFAEVGEGTLDFASIVPTSIAAGAQYLLVEQDQLYGRTVWEALQTSHDNLVELGFGDLL